MDNITLHFTTGEATIDALLRTIVAHIEATWPGRVSGYYLFGSHAEGSAIPASDIDIILVWRGAALAAVETAQLKDFAANWSRRHGIPLDLLPLAEEPLRREGHFRIKHGSVLLHGDDLRAILPDLSLTAYLSTYTRAPFGYAAEGFRHTDRLIFPLAYPDRRAPFYGYVLDNHELLKALVAAACWDASLLVSLETGRVIRSKSESVQLYRTSIGGVWADYVETLYEHGKHQWHYAVPIVLGEHRLLRKLCQEYLPFENYYFARYRRYLLDELTQGDRKRTLLAAQRLEAIVYSDDEVTNALKTLCGASDEEICTAAHRALDRLTQARS